MDLLARRAGFLCSNPICQQVTVGAAAGREGYIVVGVAAHITAASPGGPRYDAGLTPEQRRNASNGIWLCQTHAKLVDSDPAKFTAELLRSWRKIAEERSFRALMGGDLHEAAIGDTVGPATQLFKAAMMDLRLFTASRPDFDTAIALSLRAETAGTELRFTAASLGTALMPFNQMVLRAGPGAGKTTTLLQAIDGLLKTKKAVGIFVPLGEWAVDGRPMLSTILGRKAFADIKDVDLAAAAEQGTLVLALDGWNELDPTGRLRAQVEINRLKRDWPDLGILLSTRPGPADLPVDGLEVQIDRLSPEQQLELVTKRAGSGARLLLDQAWNAPGISDLIANPLYLNTLAQTRREAAFPSTREQIIRSFVKQHEKDPVRVGALRETTEGLEAEFLQAIAVEATRAANTSLTDATARALVVDTQSGLIGRKLLVPPGQQPRLMLDLFVNHHLLTRGEGGALAFQHQQFQEWYASKEVESLMRSASQGDAAAGRELRTNVLNLRQWEEPLLFAVERLSREPTPGLAAVAYVTREALTVDPMLAARLIQAGTDETWELVASEVRRFVSRWHEPEQVDRAVRFMITTGRPEFASLLWPFVSSDDDQVNYAVIRSAAPFRISCLGPDAKTQLSALPEDIRERVLPEIVFYGDWDGVRVATELAKRDSTPSVKYKVIESLLFQGANSQAAEVLDHSPDEVWSEIAQRGYRGGLLPTNARARLLREREKLYEATIDPLSRLDFLLEEQQRPETGTLIARLVADYDFPAEDRSGLIVRAHQLYPDDVVSALARRAAKGLRIPYWSRDLVAAKHIAVDSEEIVDLLLMTGPNTAQAESAALVAGPASVSRLIESFLEVHIRLASNSWRDEPLLQRHRQLSEAIARVSIEMRARAVLKNFRVSAPREIALLSRALTEREGSLPEGAARLPRSLHLGLASLVRNWSSLLLTDSRTERSQMADLAGLMGYLGSRSFLEPLKELLAADKLRWQLARGAREGAARAGTVDQSDVYSSWFNSYGGALAALEDGVSESFLIAQLGDRGTFGFGTYAAESLKLMWRREESRAGAAEEPWPYSRRPPVKLATERQPKSAVTKAVAILDAVDRLLDEGTEDAQNHALLLARVGFSMPYGRRSSTVFRLLALSRPPDLKRETLAALAEAGESLPGDVVLAGLQEEQRATQTKGWYHAQDFWKTSEWLQLLAFSDRARDLPDALRSLSHVPAPRDASGLLSALGRSPQSGARDSLLGLPLIDERYLHERYWLDALASQGSEFAARVLLQLLDRIARATSPSRIDSRIHALHIANGMRVSSGIRADVYSRFKNDPEVPILEAAILEAIDTEGLLLLVETYARRGQRRLGNLAVAIRDLALARRPSQTFRGAEELYAVEIGELRRRLFEIAATSDGQGKLAGQCLTLIDEIRDENGYPDGEPRHPDIDLNLPWPLLS